MVVATDSIRIPTNLFRMRLSLPQLLSMSRFGVAAVVVTIGLAAASPLAAQQDTLRLTLDDAIRTAIERNPSLVRAAQSQRIAEARVRLADAAFQPDLRLTAGPSFRYTPGARSSAIGESGVGGDDPFSTSIALGATTSYTILDGSARSIERARSRLDVETAGLARRRIAQDVVSRVTSMAIDVAVSRELIDVARENLAAERRQLERVDAFVEAGARPVAERFVQDAAVAAAELGVLTAERDLAASSILLALELGIEPSRPIAIATLGPTNVTAADSNVEASVEAAVASRADVAAQRSRIDAARQEILAAEAGSSLSLGLTGGIGTSYGSSSAGAFGDQFGRDNPAASLGLALSLPLFDRERTDIEAELARIETAQAELALSELERDVAAQVAMARLDYRTAIARMSVADRQLEAARRALEAEEARYASGSSTLAELALTRARYTSAAGQRVQAGYELLERRALLQYAIGATPTPGL